MGRVTVDSPVKGKISFHDVVIGGIFLFGDSLYMKVDKDFARDLVTGCGFTTAPTKIVQDVNLEIRYTVL